MTLPEAVSSSIFVGPGHIGHWYDILAESTGRGASEPQSSLLKAGWSYPSSIAAHSENRSGLGVTAPQTAGQSQQLKTAGIRMNQVRILVAVERALE